MKQEIIAKLVKIAENSEVVLDPDDYSPLIFPYNYSDLEPDPEFDAPEITSSGLYPRAGVNSLYINLPVNPFRPGDQSPTNSSAYYFKRSFPEEYSLCSSLWKNPALLAFIKRHEGAHMAAYSAARNKSLDGNRSFLTFSRFAPNPDAERYLYTELPAMVNEQRWKAAPGCLSFATYPDGRPFRAITGKSSLEVGPGIVDPYYDSMFPRVSPGSDKRKFYWTPRKGWISPTGKIEEAPFAVDTLDSFQGTNQPLNIFPKPWQNVVTQLGTLATAARQYANDPDRFRAAQDRIYRGLTPLHSRMEGEPSENPFPGMHYKNMAIEPVPIGMAELQAKHYITPTFSDVSDVRTLEQMHAIQKDIDHSYKLDDKLRQNWAPLGGNSAGA